jgi:hypothetical protein
MVSPSIRNHRRQRSADAELAPSFVGSASASWIRFSLAHADFSVTSRRAATSRAKTPLGSSHKSTMVLTHTQTAILMACSTMFVNTKNWRHQLFSRHFQTRHSDRTSLPPMNF